jgi:hypothetical protein
MIEARRFPPPGTKKHLLALVRSDSDGFYGNLLTVQAPRREAIAELFYFHTIRKRK